MLGRRRPERGGARGLNVILGLGPHADGVQSLLRTHPHGRSGSGQRLRHDLGQVGWEVLRPRTGPGQPAQRRVRGQVLAVDDCPATRHRYQGRGQHPRCLRTPPGQAYEQRHHREPDRERQRGQLAAHVWPGGPPAQHDRHHPEGLEGGVCGVGEGRPDGRDSLLAGRVKRMGATTPADVYSTGQIAESAAQTTAIPTTATTTHRHRGEGRRPSGKQITESVVSARPIATGHTPSHPTTGSRPTRARGRSVDREKPPPRLSPSP